MDGHTKEPWHLRVMDGSIGGIDSDEDYSVAQTHQRPNDSMHVERIANSRRIVACVNACAGISTENLEHNIPIVEGLMTLNKQRDELIAAARIAICALAAAAEKDAIFQNDYDKLSAAIEKATK